MLPPPTLRRLLGRLSAATLGERTGADESRLRDMSKTVNWSAEEIAFQEWLATPKKLRKPKKQSDIAKQIGVTEETLSRWKRQDGWQAAVTAIARRYLGDDIPEIFEALAKGAKKGKVAHIRLALEVTGEYQETKNVRFPDGVPISIIEAVRPPASDTGQS